MNSRKFHKVLSSAEVLIEQFNSPQRGLNLLAKYYWLKLNFVSSFLRKNLERASLRLGISRRSLERILDTLKEHNLVELVPGGYRLLSKLELNQSFVPLSQRRYLGHSCTLCLTPGMTWKDVKDILVLKLVERHARRMYFAARQDGNLAAVIGPSGQRTVRIDAARINELKDGESLGIHMPMKSVCNITGMSAKTIRAWRSRMETSGYIRTFKSFQAVTSIGKGELPKKLDEKNFKYLKEAQPNEFKRHCFLGRNGVPIRRLPTTFEFMVHPVYHSKGKRNKGSKKALN